MVQVSRSLLEHPALGTPGGSALHNSIEAIYTKLGDNANSRFLTQSPLNNGSNIDLEHNFNIAFSELTFLLYEYIPATKEILGRLTTGFDISATPGFEKTKVRVTNNSGVAKDIALVVVHGGGSGGGGGGGFQWTEPAGISPIESREADEKVYLFESGESNKLVATVKVPGSYLSGKQINLKIALYSPSTSNTILLTSTTTLIRKGVDPWDSTTNQHTSTNTALTNTVSNQYREDVLDLTDSSGLVNGVAVSPGDLLRIELLRGTDTDTADIRFLPNATEVDL